MPRRFPEHIREEMLEATAEQVRPVRRLRQAGVDETESVDLAAGAEAGAGPLTESVDLSGFEWLNPLAVGRRGRPPGVTVTTQSIALTPAADELLGRPERVAVGLAPRAIAARPADDGNEASYRVSRKTDNGRVVGGCAVTSRAVARLLAERGWPVGRMIPARYYPEQRVLVAVLPRHEASAAN